MHDTIGISILGNLSRSIEANRAMMEILILERECEQDSEMTEDIDYYLARCQIKQEILSEVLNEVMGGGRQEIN